MIRKAIDLILIAAIAVGGFYAWRSGSERMRLRATQERLARKAGDLALNDPTRAHFLALPTGEPLHFAWRVYFPAGSSITILDRNGGSSSLGIGSAEQFIARVRIREDDNGQLFLY